MQWSVLALSNMKIEHSRISERYFVQQRWMKEYNAAYKNDCFTRALNNLRGLHVQLTYGKEQPYFI